MDILESSDDEADAAAAPAPTPTVAPPPTVPVVDAVEVEELPDARTPRCHDHADGNSSPADSATASSSPTGSAAAGSSSAHAAEPAAGDEWRTEGHALLQTRVAKYYGARRTPYTGTIVGWDPLGFEGVAPLFHVVHDDGDEEDLEEHEVEPAAQLYKREAAREAAKERKLSKAAAPPPRAAAGRRSRRRSGSAARRAASARAAERKQERDAARAEKARLAAEAKRDFGNHPMPFLKPVKELDAATANDAEAVAVWEAARRVIAAKVEALEHVHGWQVAYHLRGVQTCGVGDLIVIPPEEMEKHLARRRRRADARAARVGDDDGAAAAHRQQWRQRHPQHRRALPVALPPRARAGRGDGGVGAAGKGRARRIRGQGEGGRPADVVAGARRALGLRPRRPLPGGGDDGRQLPRDVQLRGRGHRVAAPRRPAEPTSRAAAEAAGAAGAQGSGRRDAAAPVRRRLRLAGRAPAQRRVGRAAPPAALREAERRRRARRSRPR